MTLPYLSETIVRNKLSADITDVKVRFAQSDKGNGWLSYLFNHNTVDVETQAHVERVTDVKIGSVPSGGEVKVNNRIEFHSEYRGYWQVYFRYRNVSYKINKNNAMMNPWYPHDVGEYVEITIREELNDYIRLDFVMKSGNAYFYAAKTY